MGIFVMMWLICFIVVWVNFKSKIRNISIKCMNLKGKIKLNGLKIKFVNSLNII